MPITAEGVRTDGNPVPLWERETLTLPQAAQVFNIDYDGLLVAVNQRDVDVFRPLNKRGSPVAGMCARKRCAVTSKHWRNRWTPMITGITPPDTGRPMAVRRNGSCVT